MVLRIDLGGPALELVAVGGGQLAAELDGVRVPIRSRRVTREVTSVGTGRVWTGDWKDGVAAEELAGLDGLAPDRRGDAFVFAYEIEGNHFREHTWVEVAIAFRDGVVVIEIERDEQNESYY